MNLNTLRQSHGKDIFSNDREIDVLALTTQSASIRFY